MKKKCFSLCSILLCLLFIAIPCSSHAQAGEDGASQVYDALHIAPSMIEMIQPQEGDQIIHRIIHTRSDENETLYSKIKQPDTELYGSYYVIDAKDGHVDLCNYSSWMGKTEFVKHENVYSSIEESPLAFFFDFLQNPQRYIEQEVQIDELYFLGSSQGHYIYVVSARGHFILYKGPETNDPVCVFPQKDFEEFDQIYSQKFRSVEENFGVQLNEFTFTKVIEQETTADLTKYQAPFDIDGYELQTSLKTILPIAGGVLVAAAIAVAVILAKNASEREKEAAPTAD